LFKQNAICHVGSDIKIHNCETQWEMGKLNMSQSLQTN
jgi:hypothetical protein